MSRALLICLCLSACAAMPPCEQSHQLPPTVIHIASMAEVQTAYQAAGGEDRVSGFCHVESNPITGQIVRAEIWSVDDLEVLGHEVMHLIEPEWRKGDWR